MLGLPGVPTAAPPPGVGSPSPFGPPPKSRKKIGVVVTAIVVAVALFAYFFLGSSAGASDLKVKFVSGETHTYNLDMTMTGSGGNLNGGFKTNIGIGAEMTQRTGAIDKDGNATLSFTLKNFHFSENGRRTTPPPGVGLGYSLRMRPDGTVIGLDGGDPYGLEDVNPAGQFVNPSNAGALFPKNKVTVGQRTRWKPTSPCPTSVRCTSRPKTRSSSAGRSAATKRPRSTRSSASR